MPKNASRRVVLSIAAALAMGCGSDSNGSATNAPAQAAQPASPTAPPAASPGVPTMAPPPRDAAAGQGAMGGKPPAGMNGASTMPSAPAMMPPMATAGSGASMNPDPAVGVGAPAPATMGTLPPVDDVNAAGPFAVSMENNVGPGGNNWIFYPTELGKDGLKHPLVLWGAGAGSTPASTQYTTLLTRVASHGFFAYAPNMSSDSGREMTEGLDWLFAQNEDQGSPFFEHLDTSKVAFSGHSRGSLATFEVGGDERLTTTVHIAGGSFDGMGSSKLKHPAAYICGETDIALPQCQVDYENATLPVFFSEMQGVDHIGAAGAATPAIVAWLRWQLGGEEARKSMFVGDGCEFCMGMWQSQSKNW
jgi:hypothetical protein